MSSARYGWLVSYPKSGNTWVRLLLESLINGGAPVDLTALELRTRIAGRPEFDELMGVESAILSDAEIEAARPLLHKLAAEAFDGPLMLRKVHDRCWHTARGERVFPPELSRGAVYIARDPRDVAVSLSHYYAISVDRAIDMLADPGRTIASANRYSHQLPQPLGTWDKHVFSWLDHSAMPVHLVRYEDLHRDTPGELIRIAEFLGLPTTSAQAAVDSAKFETVQAQEMEKGFPERIATCKQFFREGRTGGWRDVLSATQEARITSRHASAMVRLGYL